MHRGMSVVIYALTSAVGAFAFAYPFFVQAGALGSEAAAHSQDAALVTSLVIGLSLVALVMELQGQTTNAKMVAVLGVLVAMTSVLRFLKLAMPVPGGFSPMFAPIILCGYVFGARFGFLLGAFALLVSALITGGVGPWLPYEMFAAGWVGMGAGCLRAALRFKCSASLEVFLLVCYGFAWGLLYGVIMNLYFWPFAIGPAGQSWVPGSGLAEAAVRYGAFYLATSLWWDLTAAVGNAAFLLFLGAPALHALRRFRRRFSFQLEPTIA